MITNIDRVYDNKPIG